MKNKTCQHQWKVLRKTNEKERLMTNKDYLVGCSKCKKFGYIKESDLELLMGDDK